MNHAHGSRILEAIAMSVYKHRGSKNWWYKFTRRGGHICESTQQPNKRVAEQMEAAGERVLSADEEQGYFAAASAQSFLPRDVTTILPDCALRTRGMLPVALHAARSR